MKNAGRRPRFAWLLQHCQGHEGCSCHTHTHAHTYSSQPQAAQHHHHPHTPTNSWLAHNCTRGVCMRVRLKAMPRVSCTSLPCQLLLALTRTFDTGTRWVTLWVLIRMRPTCIPSLCFFLSSSLMPLVFFFKDYWWFLK